MDEAARSEFTELDDVTFIAMRRRAREELEHTPVHEIGPEQAARFQKLNDEFLRRASLAWTQAS